MSGQCSFLASSAAAIVSSSAWARMAGSLEVKAPRPHRFCEKWSGMIEAQARPYFASRSPIWSTFCGVTSQVPTSSTPVTPGISAAWRIIVSLGGWSL